MQYTYKYNVEKQNLKYTPILPILTAWKEIDNKGEKCGWAEFSAAN